MRAGGRCASSPARSGCRGGRPACAAGPPRRGRPPPRGAPPRGGAPPGAPPRSRSRVVSARLELAGHVATVTIDRPQVMNAIDLATEAELQRIWSALEADDGVRLVVLTGAGERAFCV